MKHNPFSADTDRRVWDMVGRNCTDCRKSCGDLERCPLLRGRFFGDWSGEFAINEPVDDEPREPRPKVEVVQPTLF